MEPTYTVRGADGKEYGPASLQQIINWAREGRVNAQQEVRRSDLQHWSPAGSISELASAFTATTVSGAAPIVANSTTPNVLPSRDPATEAQLKSGNSWFYWIGGLSLINSLSPASGSNWRFILGLGITQIIDALGSETSGFGKTVVLSLDFLVAGVCILFGIFARKGHLWAFVVGMVLFALNGLIFLFVRDWVGVGFHVLALYCLYRGARACRELKSA